MSVPPSHQSVVRGSRSLAKALCCEAKIKTQALREKGVPLSGD